MSIQCFGSKRQCVGGCMVCWCCCWCCCWHHMHILDVVLMASITYCFVIFTILLRFIFPSLELRNELIIVFHVYVLCSMWWIQTIVQKMNNTKLFGNYRPMRNLPSKSWWIWIFNTIYLYGVSNQDAVVCQMPAHLFRFNFDWKYFLKLVIGPNPKVLYATSLSIDFCRI